MKLAWTHSGLLEMLEAKGIVEKLVTNSMHQPPRRTQELKKVGLEINW